MGTLSIKERLIDGPHTLGNHKASWDGTDQAGGSVEAGVYFCRLSVGGERVTKRIVLVR